MSPGADQPVKGAHIDAAALIANRFSARYLNVTRATRALAQLAGAKRSRRRGRGVEFEEVRHYAAGDDVRAIDWRVTARSGEAHTKLFHEERERPVLVAIDLRTTMRFGSRNCFKSVLAAHTASLILWSALDRGERVGGMVIGTGDARDVRPARSRRAVLTMIGEMTHPDAAGQDSEMDFAEQLKQIQRIARPGSSLFLISDFHDAHSDTAFEQLRRLVRHVQVTAVAISDPLEQQLPAAGRYAVTDGVVRSSLDTGSPSVRQRYARQYQQQREQLIERYRSLRIPVIELSTESAPLPILQRLFPAR